MVRNIMTKKVIILILFVIISVSCFLNYKVFRSINDQSNIMYEFNAYQLDLPLEYVKSVDVDFPNITITTMPLKMLKARYLMRDSLIEESLKLFHQSRKDNPFIGVPEFELGKYHFLNNRMDSALYYSKIAFEALPRNVLLSRLHFQVLAKLKNDSQLDKSFNKVKGNYILDQWRDYMFCKIEIGKTPKEELSEILGEAKGLVADKKQFQTLETIINVGIENLDDLSKIIIDAESSYAQNKFIEAANLYETAARLNPKEYTHFDNAALSYYRGNNYDQAEKLYRYTMQTFNPKSGKSEFYYGLLLYEKNKKDEACNFWNIALKKGFSGSKNVIDTFCQD